MGRMIRTGQVDLQHINATQFRNQLCAKVAPVLSCDQNLQVDVRSFNDFTTASFPNPVQNNQLDPTFTNFQIGTACQVVLVRSFYTWKVQTPMIAPFLANLAGDYRLVAAASAFRNEPYDNGVSGCS
jgi:hypothetical protein